MRILFQDGNFYRNHGFFHGDMLVEDGIIQAVGTGLDSDNTQVVELSGKRVVPGFLDIHTHGAMGVDVNGASAQDLEKICRFFASQGTTGWLGSVLTDTKKQTMEAIKQYVQWKEIEHHGAQMLGIHLEGPFLCADYKGAMPEHLLMRPDLDLIQEYQQAAQGGIRYITVSPEVEGVVAAIPGLKKMGMQVAIGHSGADYETAMAAIGSGACGATHTGNAMKLLHQHFPSVWGAVLEDDQVFCEIICDGRHLHPGTVRFIVKMKGINKVVAITDSIMAAGLPDGNYKLGVNDVVVVDGDAKLASNGTRAGSTLTTKSALKNLMEYTGHSLADVLPVLTENPARLIGVFDKVGSLQPGKEANLVVLEHGCDIERTFVRGKECFSKVQERDGSSQ